MGLPGMGGFPGMGGLPGLGGMGPPPFGFGGGGSHYAAPPAFSAPPQRGGNMRLLNMAQNTPPMAGFPLPGQNVPTPYSTQQRDPDLFRNAVKYDYSNPVEAMRNALLDIGRNPFNPADLFTRYLLRAAQGLGLAFQAQQATTPGLTVDAMGDVGANFGNFLRNALTTGSVMGTLRDTGSAITSGSLIQHLRDTLQNPGNMAQVNPFAQGLADLLAGDMGGGTATALGLLFGPSMNRSLLQAYQSALGAAQTAGLRNYLEQDFDLTPGARPAENDLWYYLLGR